MEAASSYKRYLGIQMDDCQHVNMITYPQRGTSPWLKALNTANKYLLFEPPPAGAFPHAKGKDYLAACIVKAGSTDTMVIEKLDEIVLYKTKTTPESGVDVL